jgi:hypothetical protein
VHNVKFAAVLQRLGKPHTGDSSSTLDKYLSELVHDTNLMTALQATQDDFTRGLQLLEAIAINLLWDCGITMDQVRLRTWH